MHHISTYERLAAIRVEDRVREAEHESWRRLVRAAAVTRQPTGALGPFQRVVRALTARRLAAGGVG